MKLRSKIKYATRKSLKDFFKSKPIHLIGPFPKEERIPIYLMDDLFKMMGSQEQNFYHSNNTYYGYKNNE